MKFNERKVALLAFKDNIEMELISSAESRVGISMQQKEEEHSFDKDREFQPGCHKMNTSVQEMIMRRQLEHPLVLEEKPEPEPEFQTQPRQHAKPKAESPAWIQAKQCPPVLGLMEEIHIEMEVFPPLRVSNSELVEIQSGDSSVLAPKKMSTVYSQTLEHFSNHPSTNKVSRVKWTRLTFRTGLVVRDVVCLPREHYLAQLERHSIPRGKECTALAAKGMTARITINCGWSANQMEGRLAMLFWRRFVKRTGDGFSFTYLQCLQGSNVLFVPDTPAEGWTGEQVLRISGHSDLYILSHQDYSQAAESESSASETSPVVNRKEFCVEASTESCLDEETQPPVSSPTEKLELDTILRLFRLENHDEDGGSHIWVKRIDVLHSALKAVRRPGFCFRSAALISFRGEETDGGHEGPLREFFRLSLLELQQSSVFEGPPGRLFLTYDLSALEDRKYYDAGVLIGWSMTQGGPGPRCLHPALYQLMCGQNPSLEDFSLADIVDSEAQMWLQQLHGCTNVKLLPPSLCHWVSSCGIPGIYSAHSNEIPTIYVCLVKHYIYHRVASMISQFTEGLNSCGGLWDTVRSHWEAFVPVMTSAQQQPMNLEEFKKLFTISYSHADSQLRAAEEATAGHWETVLTLVSDGQAGFSFEDLIAFITGADHVPPLGFPRLISLCFYSQDVSMSGVRLPYASTCALQLSLPRGASGAADLTMLLSRAVHEALGFTRLQTCGDGEERCSQVMTGI